MPRHHAGRLARGRGSSVGAAQVDLQALFQSRRSLSLKREAVCFHPDKPWLPGLPGLDFVDHFQWEETRSFSEALINSKGPPM